MYKKYFKRLLDIMLSFCALILLSPLLIIFYVLGLFHLGYPVIFKQERPGLNGKIFDLYKFRTMNDSRDVDGNLLPDDKRITSFGIFLRSTSIDELPELINIINGDMSIVGPRPLLVRYLPLYNEEQRHRHDVRPGLTGLAQVNGRNAITWEDKFKFDVEYVNNISFIGDLKIILQTALKVFQRADINAKNDVTMEEFRGNK